MINLADYIGPYGTILQHSYAYGEHQVFGAITGKRVVKYRVDPYKID